MEEDIEILDLNPVKESTETLEISSSKPLPTRSENYINKDEGNNTNDTKGLDNEELSPKKNKKDKGNKATNRKTFIMQLIFCSVSFLFIIGCCIFYGSRLIKYYKIYNPKAEDGEKANFLSSNISGKSEIVYEGSGLYKINGNYIYKGDVSNNYIKYNNLLWRIVRINSDDTMDIILDESINLLNWNNEVTSFDKSNIYNYLNKEFVNNLNKDLLVKASICNDLVDDLSSISCNDTINNYVKLMDISGFLNSVINQESYMISTDEIAWLSNYGSETIWHTNGTSVSKSTGDNFYSIRPVVTIKGTAIMYGGDGTLESPYLIEKEDDSLQIGDYVKLGEDTWIIYGKEDDNIKLSLNKVLDKSLPYSNDEFTFDVEDENTVAGYLNKTYYDGLSYKDLLKEVEWYIGKYNGSYSDVTSDKVKAKVGLLNINDLKFNNKLNNYHLSSYNDEYVYVYGDILKEAKPTIMKNIRPCIAISDNTNISDGDGSLNNPYVVEVE